MMKKTILLALLMLTSVTTALAQRTTDKLDRGLVAVKTANGVFCSWRIMGEEYYDVTYNLYRDGTKIASNLSVSNYSDAVGTTASKYTVKAVVRGVEQAASKEAAVWENSYLEITPDHGSLTSTYVPNDACMADVDGDGELEILMKFDNASWAGTSYQKAGYNGEYFIMEVFKLNGKKLWWVELGPNMADFQNNEQNIVAYDWDGDGKAEAVMRASDGTKIHMANGEVRTIGDASKNYLNSNSSGQWFIFQGNEYLVYMNGETGEPYEVMEYPLKRLEPGETDLEKAWGDGYGHRSSKHFFGAPYLDGRKPSIFLGRGIYTRHKFVALDVNPQTHKLTERWRWTCNDPSSPWYGNGYHNYGIADVDWDGRDEICWGSMVIDDNGHGLSTTGFGHGDAQHHGDFNPYKHGQEIFACLEDAPYWGNDYRDGTTAKLYHKYTSGRDDGRCIAGNFSNDYPGAMAFSGYDNPINCVTGDYVNGMTKGNIPDNMRIYWDGDLCEEGFNYINGKNTSGGIYKYGKGRIETLTGSMTNNDTKGTPCYLGDVLGDWREEVIMRTADNKIRIYTTTIPTEWRNYTLWHDMQYRNAMVWQMCGYNQPPHTSYFLGELEGITMAPPALTMTNRTEVTNGGSISSAQNDKQVLMAETGDMTVSVSDGASPYIFFDNAPSWVQGTDVDGTSGKNAPINYSYYTHTLTGGAFTGSMRLVKQGDGTLVLPKVTETYTGNTDVWAGTLQFDGTMQASPVWLNRHTNLISNGGTFNGGIKADYNATIYPGGKDNAGTLTTTTLALGFGSRIVIDVNTDGTTDKLTVTKLTIEKKDWQYGPEYSTPVIEFNGTTAPAGKYEIASIGELTGNIEDIVVEGLTTLKKSVSFENGKLYLNIDPLRDATDVTWDGGTNGIWDFADTENFKTTSGNSAVFVTGDKVTFDDKATQANVTISGEIAPAEIIFANETKDITIGGDGKIINDAKVTVQGEGNVIINNINSMTGGVYLKSGKLTAATLANTEGTEFGSLGALSNSIHFDGGTLAISSNATVGHPFILHENGGTIDVGKNTLSMNSSITRRDATVHGVLTKTGSGTLNLITDNKIGTLYVDNGTVNLQEKSDVINGADNIVFNGENTVVVDPNNSYTYSENRINYIVSEGANGKLYLDGRCNYRGTLTGSGTLTVYATYVRNILYGNWSNFEGELIANHSGDSYEFTWQNNYGLPNAILNIASGTTFSCKQNTLKVGSLAGSGILAMPANTTTNLYVGSDNRDMKFGGSFSGKVNITKEGTGSWTFTGATDANEYFFKNGDIILNNTKVKSSFFGSATANVQNDGRLMGVGTVGNVRVFEGGTVEPGDVSKTRHYGAITSTGFMYFYPDTKLNLNVYKVLTNNNGRSFIVVNGKLELNGEINIGMGSEYEPAIGDEFIMWTCGSLEGTPTAINLAPLPAGMKWDTSDLMKTTGILRVVADPAGIKNISSDQVSEGEYYTIDGVKVENPTKKGLYIKNGKKMIIK